MASEITVCCTLQVCSPILSHIRRWIADGEIEDPYNEFFIENDTSCLDHNWVRSCVCVGMWARIIMSPCCFLAVVPWCLVIHAAMKSAAGRSLICRAQ